MQNSNLLFLAAVLLIASCWEHNSDSNSRLSTSDTLKTFISEIPTYKHGRLKGDTSNSFKAIKEQSKQLDLTNLYKGYDSLEIRIWLGHSLAVKRNVVIINRTNSKWSGQLVTFKVGHYEKDGAELVDNKQVDNVTPKSGWKSFTERLFSYQVMTLPNEDDINGYNGCGADGLPYYFEIATRHQYRFFTYCNIEGNIQNFPQARHVDNIARLLEKELSFKFTR